MAVWNASAGAGDSFFYAWPPQHQWTTDQQQLHTTQLFPPQSNPLPLTHHAAYLNAPSYQDSQTQEIDTCIKLAQEKLRDIMEQQATKMMRRLELRALSVLQRKDTDIAKLRSRTKELEELLKNLELERRAWQQMAKENEAIAVSLNKAIEELRYQGGSCFNNDTDDAASSCQGNPPSEDYARAACRACNAATSCILFLPCRHLSSCKSCERFLDRCPFCQTIKNGIIEALVD